jgi:NADH:ubiquinone oxidoreductase subunit 5 (subunit L)/multisubunit Na+/H+ antiporter MnhA subunit
VFLGQLSPKHYKLKKAPVLMMIPMIILSGLTVLFGIFPNIVLRIISRIQTSVGLPGLQFDGTRIVGTNGTLDPTLIVVIFGIGFAIALILFLLHPKSRKVELMDTYTASEFIYTPELLHYSHSFYAPFERLYDKAPDTSKWYKAILKKVVEIGNLVSYSFFSSKPRITVFWIVIVTIALLWGGSV